MIIRVVGKIVVLTARSSISMTRKKGFNESYAIPRVSESMGIGSAVIFLNAEMDSGNSLFQLI